MLIFANPEFDQRSMGGISRLYQVFCNKYGFNIQLINEEFLKSHLPVQGQVLVIAGGDGTIHRAINTIPDEYLKSYILGIIPGGTANEYAKSLGLPPEIEQAAEIVANQRKVITHKPGVMNAKHKFVTGFLYGIACKVLNETSRGAKHYLGQYAYQLPGLFSIAGYHDFIKEFKCNGKGFSSGYLLINSASLTSKGLHPKNEDGEKFSIVYLKPDLSISDFARLLLKNHPESDILEDPAILYEQLDRIGLEFEGKLEFMLDGEIYTSGSPILFEHCGQYVNVII